MLDILELLVARIFECYVNFAAHLPESIVRYANAARRGDAFQSRRNVDAIAENLTVLDDDVADMNADTDFNTPLGRDVLVTLRHSALRLDRATRGINGAAEFDQESVAGAFDDAAVVFGACRFKESPTGSMEPRQLPFLVRAHEPAVASDIRRENGGEPPFHAL